MRYIIYLACVLSAICSQSLAQNSTDDAMWPPIIKPKEHLISMPQLTGGQMRVCSYSIQAEDSEPKESYEKWKNRIVQVAHILKDCRIDFAGTQEAHAWQLKQLEEKTGMLQIATISHDGKVDTTTASCAIFYNPARFELIEQGQIRYPQETDPDSRNEAGKHSKVFCTWGLFKDNESGKNVYVFNANLNSGSEGIRTEQAALLARQAEQIAGDEPLIITGNFHTLPYRKAVMSMRNSGKLQDSRTIAYTRAGSEGTYHGYKVLRTVRRMDYIFLSHEFSVGKYTVVDEEFTTKRPGSDHLPVIADVSFK